VTAAVEVVDPGALTTIQDLGRPGHAHLGVPRSGALDAPALMLANRLVGNAEGAAGLETTLTGITFRALTGVRVAVTGAGCEVRVDGRGAAYGASVVVPPGAVVEVGAARTGLRSYVALAGGVVAEPVLGSCSTDLLSGLGPPVLRAGDRIELGTPGPPPAQAEAVGWPLGHELRLDLGPRADWFTPDALAALDGAVYEVAAASNRIGLRLRGDPVTRVRDEELPTEPMVLGAVQVPPNGQPLVFLADHPTTGGYPVVAVVRTADLPVCAQARPGDRLTLRVPAAPGAAQGRRPGS
jgi:biotin-dependent carboxylase-like uncharacterized protein